MERAHNGEKTDGNGRRPCRNGRRGLAERKSICNFRLSIFQIRVILGFSAVSSSLFSIFLLSFLFQIGNTEESGLWTWFGTNSLTLTITLYFACRLILFKRDGHGRATMRDWEWLKTVEIDINLVCLCCFGASTTISVMVILFRWLHKLGWERRVTTTSKNKIILIKMITDTISGVALLAYLQIVDRAEDRRFDLMYFFIGLFNYIASLFGLVFMESRVDVLFIATTAFNGILIYIIAQYPLFMAATLFVVIVRISGL